MLLSLSVDDSPKVPDYPCYIVSRKQSLRMLAAQAVHLTSHAEAKPGLHPEMVKHGAYRWPLLTWTMSIHTLQLLGGIHLLCQYSHNSSTPV
jgi:hypothetical protein